ncbi:MAG: hypothetical protein AAFR16_14680, partial [Pseudomonadota bacterium]
MNLAPIFGTSAAKALAAKTLGAKSFAAKTLAAAATAATVLSAGLAPAQAATQAATRQITLCLSEDVRGAETAPHRFGRPEAVRRAWNEW